MAGLQSKNVNYRLTLYAINALLARNLRAGLYTKQSEPSVKDSH